MLKNSKLEPAILQIYEKQMDIPNFIQMEIWKVCDNISGTAAFLLISFYTKQL